MQPKKVIKSGKSSANIYETPHLEILFFEKEDVITKSEIGGQWPWGETQGANFGE